MAQQKRPPKKAARAAREAETPHAPSFVIQAEPHADASLSAMPILPVTHDMLDHAAHRAAELADAVAHHGAASLPVGTSVGAADLVTAPVVTAPVATPLADDTVETAADPVEAVHEETRISWEPAEAVAEPSPAAADASGPAARSSDVAAGEEADPADALERYNTTLLDMMRTNMAATGAHVAALMRVKSVPEAVALSDGHLRRQFDVMAEQGRELSRLAQSLTFAVLQPRKGVMPPER